MSSRNIFDQYGQPENRLTHALVCALANDRKLLNGFVRWVTRGPLPKGALQVVEQRVPGELEEVEGSQEGRGIPDGWIFNEDGWALLIESKASAQISTGQLRRHIRTAERHGFKSPRLLVLTARSHKRELGHGIVQRTWPELYEWLVNKNQDSKWAKHVAQYLEVAETKFAAEEYLLEGALTVFSGIPFNKDSPYNYLEAKRLLKLAMDELRKRRDLVKELGMNPAGIGRGAITGTKGNAIWDFLPLKIASGGGSFTSAPHLTMSIRRSEIITCMTIPNGIRPEWRQRIQRLDEEEFRKLLGQVNRRMKKALRGATGATPWVELVQRHYISQRSSATIDAKLEFDLRTAFGGGGRVKGQPGWLSATHAVFKRPKANIQLIVGAVYPYDACKKVQSRQILDHIAATWIACKPLLEVMLGKK